MKLLVDTSAFAKRYVACALEWKSDFFLTSDKRQFMAVKNAGLLTEFIGHQNV